MIPENILKENRKWHEEIQDLMLESKCAQAVDKLFFNPHIQNFFIADAVQEKLRQKLYQQSPVFKYLLDTILNKD